MAATKLEANFGKVRGHIFVPFLIGTTVVAASAGRIERYGRDAGVMTIGAVAVGCIAFVVGAAREARGASARETGFKFVWTLLCAVAFVLSGILGWARFNLHGPSLAAFLLFVLSLAVCGLGLLGAWLYRLGQASRRAR